MENKFLNIENWMEKSETENWLIDELIFDPHFETSGCIVKDREQFYFVRYGGFSAKNTASPLPHYVNSPVYDRAKYNHQFFMIGVEPRSGFKPAELGRPINPDEFAELKSRLELTDDDISGDFEDTIGGLYGPKSAVSVTVKQIKLTGNPIPLESELKGKGIEAYAPNGGRLNIRVK